MSRYQAAYNNPQGPGDARPTALQIVKDENCVGALKDKVIFITGANQGIGLETTRALYATGATIYLGVRDLKKGQEAIDNILSTSTNADGGSLHLIQMSLDSLESVRSAARAFLAQSTKLNILINNAGIMAAPQARTVDGFESQFGINHLGHFLLFQLLKPALLASTTPSFNSRVVVLASSGHRHSGIRFHDINFDEPGSYDPYISYGQAKTANIYFANEIERRYGSKGLHALSLHPGAVWTNLAQFVQPDKAKEMQEANEGNGIMMNAGQGAATTVYAAISKEWEGRGGRYLANCIEQGPRNPGSRRFDGSECGYATWAYDEKAASELWKLSCELVHVEFQD